MFGATGAVGNHAALTLSKIPSVQQLTLLGRRQAENVAGQSVVQHVIDIFSAKSYACFLKGHDSAICALGVGQPSKMCKEDFIKIDKNAVLDFATACKKAGVTHFQLLSSVGVSASSSSFYLRTKGELEEGLKALGFERLSLFHPSMIMTPTNRYGFSQAVTLAVMPVLDPLFVGSFNKFRSITATQLGKAMAANLFKNSACDGVEILHWRDFIALSKDI